VAFVFDLLPFEAMSAIQCWPQLFGAAGNVKAQRLIELGQALFELVDQPAREAFGFGDGELAEFAPVQAMAPRQKDELQRGGRSAPVRERNSAARALGTLRKSRFCMTVRRRSPLPRRSASSAAARS